MSATPPDKPTLMSNRDSGDGVSTWHTEPSDASHTRPVWSTIHGERVVVRQPRGLVDVVERVALADSR